MLANGRTGDVLTPWHVVIDTTEQTITVSKRNRVLIGVDEDTLSFRFIRRITIDRHLIGADISNPLAELNQCIFDSTNRFVVNKVNIL